jgi:hypothetical protein
MRLVLAFPAILWVAAAACNGDGGACTYFYSECCTVPDHLPCKGLSETQCRARDYCLAVDGRPWNDETATEGFVACRSSCEGYEIGPTCVYDPSNPSACYYVSKGAIPDGWSEIFECNNIPAGLCGTK